MNLPGIGLIPLAQLQAILAALAVLGLWLVWWRTGRMRWVGWLLNLLWLPLRASLWLLWVLCALLRPPLGRIVLWGWFASGFFADASWPPVQALYPGPAWGPGLLFLLGMVLFARPFGGAVEILWRWKPRSRGTHVPTPKPKAPPVVAVAASAGGWADSETRILRQLPPHLRALIERAGNEEPLFPPEPIPEPEPDPQQQTQP